jgi:hypothetical protein
MDPTKASEVSREKVSQEELDRQALKRRVAGAVARRRAINKVAGDTVIASSPSLHADLEARLRNIDRKVGGR